MMKASLQKRLVLTILFVFPIVVYLFFASGKNNFARLPVLSEGIAEVDGFESVHGKKVVLRDRITILNYWLNPLENKKTEALNLNQKIYKRFYEFDDFQFVVFVESGSEEAVEQLKSELEKGTGTDLSKWNFLLGTRDAIKAHFSSLKIPPSFEQVQQHSWAFIIDKDLNLRGRNDDPKEETVYGFDAQSVATINNMMVDDVKVILAEYRLALKKYNSKREK